MQKSIENLVGHARLAGAAGAGDPNNGHVAGAQLPAFAQRTEFLVTVQPLLDRRNRARPGDVVVALDTLGGSTRFLRTRHQILNHGLKTQLHAVIRMIDALNAVADQLLNLLRRNGTAATAKHSDVLGIALAQHVHHVLEVLHVAALIRADRNAVGIFLQRCVDHVGHAAVVPQMNHLNALGLNQAAHDVDRRVMAVEQRRGRYKAQRRLGRSGSGSWNISGGTAHGGS